jgi:hypothetical protein
VLQCSRVFGRRRQWAATFLDRRQPEMFLTAHGRSGAGGNVTVCGAFLPGARRAKECSPARKRWVIGEGGGAPERGERSQDFVFSPRSGALLVSGESHGSRHGLHSYAPPELFAPRRFRTLLKPSEIRACWGIEALFGSGCAGLGSGGLDAVSLVVGLYASGEFPGCDRVSSASARSRRGGNPPPAIRVTPRS